MAALLRTNSSSSVSSVSSMDSNNSEIAGKDGLKSKNIVQRTRDALGDIGNRLKKNPSQLGAGGSLPAAKKEVLGAKKDFAVPTNRPPRAAAAASKPKAKTTEKPVTRLQTQAQNNSRKDAPSSFSSLKREGLASKPAAVPEITPVFKARPAEEKSCDPAADKENALPVTKPVVEESSEAEPVVENEYNPKISSGSSEMAVDSGSPVEIVDIDQDEKNPLLVQTYIKDIYNYVFNLEKKHPVRIRYLEGRLVNSRMRGVLLDWLIEVHTQFGFMPETLYMTSKMLDRYLQADRTVTRKHLQLVGVTAMYVAAKFEEVCTPAVQDFAAVSDNAFTVDDVRKMEQSMLTTLNFDLSFPPAVFFLRRFSKAANATMAIHSMAKYIMELSIVDYSACHLMPSKQAAGSLALALLILENNSLSELWTPTLQHYTRTDLESVKPIVTLLAGVLSRAHEEGQKLKAVYKKYTGKRLNYTSNAPELKSDAWKTRVMKEVCRMGTF